MTNTELLNHFDARAIKRITYCEDNLQDYCECHETVHDHDFLERYGEWNKTDSVHDFLEKYGDRRVIGWDYWGDDFELEVSFEP